MMENTFYFMLKTPFVETFTFFSRSFGFVEKRLDMVNFKIYDVTNWTTNNYNAHITQYLNKLK